MAKIGLSAPWHVFYREVEALFKDDPEVRVIYDEDKNAVNLFVDNADKAEALAELLPGEREFGSVVVTVNVIPANNKLTSKGDLFERAFKGNKALSFCKTIHGVLSNDLTYIVFRKEVVQYWTDNLGDYNGICSTLYQNVAEDVFGPLDGVFFCTDTTDGLVGADADWP